MITSPAEPEQEVHCVDFGQVLHDELTRIRLRRKYVNAEKCEETHAVGPTPHVAPATVDKRTRDALAEARDRGLVGLAFSGGGIRSATFCLGVLQALARLKILRVFDYLSTVSGGGYIGAWFTAWVKRAGSVPAIEGELNPRRCSADVCRMGTGEPQPLQHLRAHTSYLAPRRGVMSIDNWVLGVIYLRNLLLNQLVLLPALVAVLFAVRVVVVIYAQEANDRCHRFSWSVVIALAMCAFFWIAYSLSRLDKARCAESCDSSRASRLPQLQHRAVLMHWLTIVPLCTAVLLATWLLAPRPITTDTSPSVTPMVTAREVLRESLKLGLIFMVVHGIPYILFRRSWKASSSFFDYLWWWVGALSSGFVGGLLLGLATAYALQGMKNDPAARATFGPPLLLVVYALGSFFEVGMLRRHLDEDAREWWASLIGRLATYSAIWVSILGTVIYGSRLVFWAWEKAPWSGFPALAAGWIGPTLAGLKGAKGPQTGVGPSNKRLLDAVVLIAPHIFLTGLLAFSSTALQLAFSFRMWDDPFAPAEDASPLVNTLQWLIVAAVGSLAIASLFAWRIDINLFSMNSLYGNRLIRCYLGASRPRPVALGDTTVAVPGPPPRRPNAFTGFDPNDDLPLHAFVPGAPSVSGDLGGPPGQRDPYLGPYHLVNTSLNLVHGEELAWQERKAASFVLSPLYCGSDSTGYAPTLRCRPGMAGEKPHYEPGFNSGVSLGKAVSLSGAAVSPNMGFHSVPAVAALLTLFNVRLGGWVGNPHSDWTWNSSGPPFGLFRLLKEMFGRTDARSRYLYLSDGGHFENLGVYELVRRRCRFIVAIDAEEDSRFGFEGLGSAVRKCRTDFGIRVDVNVAPLRPQGPNRLSEWHGVVGVIHYEDVDPQALPGILVYIKSTLTGDEASDVQNYRASYPDFPHQPTLNQFFTESQFESYRALGHHVATRVFGAALDRLRREGRPWAPDAELKGEGDRELEANYKRAVERLFLALQTCWNPPPPRAAEAFLRVSEGYSRIESTLRRDPRVRAFCHDIYPELGPSPVPSDASAELALVAEMLQAMEDAYIGLSLGEHYGHPFYRGWLSVFHRWTNSTTFRRYWPILRGEFQEEFVRFCESELGVRFGHVLVQKVTRLDEDTSAVLDAIVREFHWERQRGPQLRERLDDLMTDSQVRADVRLWVIRLDVDEQTVLPCGVCFTVWKKEPAPVWEMFVWLRHAYRNLCVGREAMEDILRQLDAEENSPDIVRASVGIAPTDDRERRTGLLMFFGQFGFRQILGGPTDQLVVERNRRDPAASFVSSS
jgi:hypothetical protein